MARMAYMLLIMEPPGQRATRTEAEGHEVYDQMTRFAASLKQRGLLQGAESLSWRDGTPPPMTGWWSRKLNAPLTGGAFRRSDGSSVVRSWSPAHSTAS